MSYSMSHHRVWSLSQEPSTRRSVFSLRGVEAGGSGGKGHSYVQNSSVGLKSRTWRYKSMARDALSLLCDM